MSEMTDQPGREIRPVAGDGDAAARPAQQLAGTSLRVDLPSAVAALLAEGSRAGGGHRARTLLKDAEIRVVLIALEAGARLAEHHAPGRITIHTLSGHLLVREAGEAIDLPAGHLLSLARSVPHDVEAREASTFLLTIAWPGDRAGELPTGEA